MSKLEKQLVKLTSEFDNFVKEKSKPKSDTIMTKNLFTHTTMA